MVMVSDNLLNTARDRCGPCVVYKSHCGVCRGVLYACAYNFQPLFSWRTVANQPHHEQQSSPITNVHLASIVLGREFLRIPTTKATPPPPQHTFDFVPHVSASHLHLLCTNARVVQQRALGKKNACKHSTIVQPLKCTSC